MQDALLRFEKKLDKLEKQLRFYGYWVPPDEEVPKIDISPYWKPEMPRLAQLMNRIMKMRCLPVLSELVGPAREDLPDTFLHDHETFGERLEFVQREFHLLIEYLGLVPEFDITDFLDED